MARESLSQLFHEFSGSMSIPNLLLHTNLLFNKNEKFSKADDEKVKNSKEEGHKIHLFVNK